MRFKLDSHKWIFDKKHLGFVSINTYTDENLLSEFEVIESIKQGLLIDGHFGREIEISTLPTSVYGAINLDELEKSDFAECDNISLKIITLNIGQIRIGVQI